MTLGITAAGLTTAAGIAGGVGALAGGAGTLISAFSGGGGGGGGGGIPGSIGQVVTLPTFDFTEPRFRALSEFVTENIQNIAEGGVPLFLERQLPTIRQGLERELQNTFFGIPGQREQAVIPQIESQAARLGTGGGTAVRQTERALDRFSQQSQRIDEFIAAQTLQGTQQTIGQLGAISQGIPQGPPSTVIGGFPPQSAPSQGGAISDIFGAIPDILGGIGDLFPSSGQTSGIGPRQISTSAGVGTRNFGAIPINESGGQIVTSAGLGQRSFGGGGGGGTVSTPPPRQFGFPQGFF
jgi:hypothetical protein